jgi:hypothetical protein
MPILKLLGRGGLLVLAAFGLLVWLGVTALIVAEALKNAGDPNAIVKARAFIAAAGAIIGLVGSVIILRLRQNVTAFLLTLALGLFAVFAGFKINPIELATHQPLPFIGVVIGFAVSFVVLAASKKLVPFLVAMALFGFAGVGALQLWPAAFEMSPAPEAAPPMAEPPADQAAAAKTEEAAPPAASSDNVEASRAAPPVASEAAPSPPPPAPEKPRMQAQAAPQADLNAPSGGGGLARSRTLGGNEKAAEESAGEAPPTAAIEAGPAPTLAPTDAKPIETPNEQPKSSDFQVAELKFNKPTDMELGKTYVVDAVIAGEKAKDETISLGNVGPTVSRQTKITRKVRVELVANDFEITKLHSVDTVLITPESSGQWSWRVKPLTPGVDRRMLLQVFGVLERDGVAQGDILIKTYEEKIPVNVTPLGRVRMVSQDIVTNWEPVAGALGVLGGIWAFLANLFAGRRKEHA